MITRLDVLPIGVYAFMRRFLTSSLPHLCSMCRRRVVCGKSNESTNGQHGTDRDSVLVLEAC
jgi:hypothetical protein